MAPTEQYALKYYREKFYSLETKELLFSLYAVDESTVYPIDNEFMEYHTEYNQHLIINTVTFKVLNAYEYYDKYESLVLTQGDKHILSNTHTLRVAKYGEEKSELPSIEVNTVAARYDVGAFAYKNVIIINDAKSVVVFHGTKYTLHEITSTLYKERIISITGLGTRTKAAARSDDL